MSRYTKEKYDEFGTRAKEFIEKNPDASRSRISSYAGVYAGTLDRNTRRIWVCNAKTYDTAREKKSK